MDISVVLPIHVWNEKVEVLFDKALDTTNKQDGIEDKIKVFVVYSRGAEEMLKSGVIKIIVDCTLCLHNVQKFLF